MCLDWHGAQREGQRDKGFLRGNRQEGIGEEISHAVDSHATVGRAIGALITVHRISPAAAFEILREVSQHTNIKLHSIAESLLAWTSGQPLPEPVGQELDAAVQRRRLGDTPEEPR
ncbi:ANTAR domain-containing protein [Streptomyces sp. NPDC048362]|uniref:ANTAR domain-containing protein n=1 Tax=Streptomyces sp. NPDC048362 TaxID=3365539 RepID=UPI0037227935